jgi:hypothetical protein
MKTTKVYGNGIFGIRNPLVRPYGIATPTEEDIMRRAEGNRRIAEKRAARRGASKRELAEHKRKQLRMKIKSQDKKIKEEQKRLYLEQQKRKNSFFGMMKIPGLKMKRGGKNVSKPKKSRKTSTKSQKSRKK